MSVLSSSTALQTLLAQFQARYPRGSLIAELLTIHQHHYVVRAMVQLEGVVLTTGMAAAPDIEAAEDRAKYRALEALGLLTAASRTPAQSLSTSPSFNSDSTALPVSDPSLQPLKTLAEPVRTSATTLRSESAPLPPVMPTSFSATADGPALKLSFPEEEPVPQAPQSAFEHSPQTASPQTASEEAYLDADPTHLVLNQSSLPDAQAAQSHVSLETARSSPKNKKSQPNTPSATVTSPPTPADRSEEIAKIGFEMKRLGWSTEQGREYLKRTYGKRSRQELNDEELISFLQYLEAQPAPLQTPF